MDFFTEERLTEVAQYLQGLREQDDRSLVIMVSARLEFLLKNSIKKRLLEPRSRQDFSVDNLDFSKCISLAYQIGIVHRLHAVALDALRKIRNNAGHFNRTFSLNEPELRQLIQTFTESWNASRPDAHFRSLYQRELSISTCTEKASLLTTASIFFVFYLPLSSVTPTIEQLHWLENIG